MASASKKLIYEASAVTFILVAVTSILNSLQHISVVGQLYGLVFALMFLYVPAFLLHRSKRQIDFIDRSASSYLKSVLAFIVASAIVFPAFLMAAHLWETIILGSSGPAFSGFPGFAKLLPYHFIMVALPEEFFFRGYLQSTLNLVFPRRRRILGANLGAAWVVTAAVFAAAHSCISVEWWHFAIFFPALVFGYLRELTGSITAPILFHGTANIIMALIGNLYR